ncbi:FtsK/SpoIIIE domain-containing protein [Actinacidiphila sp. ITFR-21]|uniref:FtsK/SpoIIIE domain-containing protein n=1 Tax=Actinacidiphila sp. ITFR-21 TaxID=3075199 RepID=UPI002889CF48|nr:FtsK/SpoIIIE domain-containing protein [Streptomyces sp. ITFR-21]WNI19860.1 FtsK/SpoIIIE domain-containing protein [Streptomyces sp. ITFR-21]
MAVVTVLVLTGAGVAGVLILRRVRPNLYWMLVGGPVARVRVGWSYGSVMDACGLAVPPSRARIAVAKALRREMPANRPPKLLRLRTTRTGLVARIRLQAGQDAFDVASAADRLRHSWHLHQVTVKELRSGILELTMTGYDVLARVRVPARAKRSALRVPVAMREDGTLHYRDFRKVPHCLTVGATESGKSVYQRGLVKELASQPVALVGIDCKGVELAPLARRFTAMADNPDTAADLLDALVTEMTDRFQVIRAAQRVSADTPDAEITSDIWGLPEAIRPVPIVVVVDEVAELLLISSAAQKKRRERIITSLIRLGQLARAAGIYLEICGQRFGSELGDGVTALRAQLTGRVCHRVNDEASAKMAFGDISPEALSSVLAIVPDQPGVAVAADTSGGWSRIRTPNTTLRDAVSVCTEHAGLTPLVPALANFRPHLAPLAPGATVTKPVPATA